VIAAHERNATDGGVVDRKARRPLPRGSTRRTPPASTEVATTGRTIPRARALRRKAGVRISAAPSGPSLALSPKSSHALEPSTWSLFVQSSSRRPMVCSALGGFRSAWVSSHAGDARRRCWSGRAGELDRAAGRLLLVTVAEVRLNDAALRRHRLREVFDSYMRMPSETTASVSSPTDDR
jgi:hypothetical protein